MPLSFENWNGEVPPLAYNAMLPSELPMQETSDTWVRASKRAGAIKVANPVWLKVQDPSVTEILKLPAAKLVRLTVTPFAILEEVEPSQIQ